MAKIITRIGTRCMNHPHRETNGRCSRCGHPFCFACLDQLAGRRDHWPGWHCAPCLVTSLAEEAAAAHARSFRGRLERVRGVARVLTPGAAALAVLAALAGLSLRYLGPKPAHDTPCGELTRIRSVAAIGVPGPSEAINFLTYPHRASVGLLAPRGPTGDRAGAMGQPVAGSGVGADPAALVDECATGWRSGPDVALPVALLLEPRKQGSYVHRLALWQDPHAQRSEWVKDFELLASACSS